MRRSQGNVGALNSQVEQLSNDGKYPQATPIAEQALALASACSDRTTPRRFRSVKNLGDVYYITRPQRRGGAPFKRALEARERVLGSEHPDTLVSVNDLAVLYQTEKRYAEAEPLFKRALEARERVLGAENPTTLQSVSNLASLYDAEGRSGEAEPCISARCRHANACSARSIPIRSPASAIWRASIRPRSVTTKPSR